MKKSLIFCIFLAFNIFTFAQTSYQCYPPNWFTGMKMNKVQVMVHGDNIGKMATDISINYPGVKLDKVNKVENSNYVFLDLTVTPMAKPGIIKFAVKHSESSKTINFELKEKRKGRNTSFAQGVTSKDFIYLIMPDRFSNGDPTNDIIPGMRDRSLRRDTVFNRHGGDLQGITNHLDYLQNLGVTTLWLNPVLENDMPNRTEHGYAFTNHYKIDERLGGEKAYQQLIDASHAKGMKVIQDAVYNHVGLYHHTVQDPPMKDWLHQWKNYTNTTYKDQTLFDPYGSKKDYKEMADGWFTREMPDLNQSNPYVANFLIQHAVWTVEQFGIDGWRIDTYAYNDLPFMNRCNKALMDEYPQLTMFGETYVHGVINQSYFCQSNLNIPFKSNLQAVTDFQTLWGIQEAMTNDFGWTNGVNKLYTNLSYDFLYKDPSRNVIFLDNHDISRFYSTLGENMDKYKSSLCWLFTCRGIPQLYYSSELATPGIPSPNDGYLRMDFPGGWPEDKINKFNKNERTGKDAEIWDHVYTLANFRKTSSALTTGKFMQYLPDDDGVYVYFRYDNKQTIMVVMNTAKTDKKIKFSKFAERTGGFTQYTDILTGKKSATDDFNIGSYKTVVLELNK